MSRLYKFMVAAPSKSMSTAASVLGLAAAAWPDWFREQVGDNMTSATIQQMGVALLVISALYFFLLWWLKPVEGAPTGTGVAQTTSGNSAHAIINHGTMHIGAALPSIPEIQPAIRPIARELSQIEVDIVLAGLVRDSDGSEVNRKNELAAKRARTRSEVKIGTRDVSLPEALAYVELGQWGKSFFDAAKAAKNEANEQLERFRQLAHDGVLTVWGKQIENGVFQIISKDHWIDHHIEWFDLLRGKARTENVRHTHAEPFSELMVSKAEFEREWPHAHG